MSLLSSVSSEYVLALFSQFWQCPYSPISSVSSGYVLALFSQFWQCPYSPISSVSSWLAVHHTKSVGHHTHHLLVSWFESPSLTAFLRLRDNAKLHRHLELACCCSWGDLSKCALHTDWAIWESGIGIIWKFCHTGPGPWPFSCTDWVWGGWKCSPDDYFLIIHPIWFIRVAPCYW